MPQRNKQAVPDLHLSLQGDVQCGFQVVEKDAAPETVAAVREGLRQELAQRMKQAASAQALVQARAQAEAHAHSQLEALLAQKAAGLSRFG